MKMKVKVFCERTFYKNNIKEDIPYPNITVYNERIVEIDLRDIITEFKHKGYWYSNTLYDYIHKTYKWVDILTYNGSELEYEIVEEGFLEDIPYLNEPLESVEQFIDIMKGEEINE